MPPEEMKGDRSYHEILRRMGVKNIGELHVQNPVILSAQVDDLSEIHAPLANNLYHACAVIGANAAQRSGCYLVSAGCWVKIFTSRNHFIYWTIDGTPPVLLNLAEVIPRVLGGEAALADQRTRLFVARDAAGVWAQPVTWACTWNNSTNWAWPWVQLYLPPGRVLYCTEATDDADIICTVAWTELPPAPPGG